ncbi:MAG TPA: hypothetical protein V6D23_13525, partial [Candidatus Obscuribacterales bacterium]
MRTHSLNLALTLMLGCQLALGCSPQNGIPATGRTQLQPGTGQPAQARPGTTRAQPKRTAVLQAAAFAYQDEEAAFADAEQLDALDSESFATKATYYTSSPTYYSSYPTYKYSAIPTPTPTPTATPKATYSIRPVSSAYYSATPKPSYTATITVSSAPTATPSTAPTAPASILPIKGTLTTVQRVASLSQLNLRLKEQLQTSQGVSVNGDGSIKLDRASFKTALQADLNQSAGQIAQRVKSPLQLSNMDLSDKLVKPHRNQVVHSSDVQQEQNSDGSVSRVRQLEFINPRVGIKRLITSVRTVQDNQLINADYKLKLITPTLIREGDRKITLLPDCTYRVATRLTTWYKLTHRTSSLYVNKLVLRRPCRPKPTATPTQTPTPTKNPGSSASPSPSQSPTIEPSVTPSSEPNDGTEVIGTGSGVFTENGSDSGGGFEGGTGSEGGIGTGGGDGNTGGGGGAPDTSDGGGGGGEFEGGTGSEGGIGLGGGGGGGETAAPTESGSPEQTASPAESPSGEGGSPSASPTEDNVEGEITVTETEGGETSTTVTDTSTDTSVTVEEEAPDESETPSE